MFPRTRSFFLDLSRSDARTPASRRSGSDEGPVQEAGGVSFSIGKDDASDKLASSRGVRRSCEIISRRTRSHVRARPR